MKRLSFILCSLLLLAGCSTPHISEQKGGAIQLSDLGTQDGIMIEGKFNEDGSFKKNISFVGEKMGSHKFMISDVRGTDVNGIKKIQISVLNRTSEKVYLQYHFSWMDASGMEVDTSLENWRSFTIFGKQTKAIVGTSNSIHSQVFRAFIRPIEYSK